MEQDLHTIDLVSASGNGACTFTAAGYQSMAEDILRDRRHDISTKAVFSYTLAVLPASSKRLDTRRPTVQPLWMFIIIVASTNGWELAGLRELGEGETA